ncbi:sugar ABC transporter substrate-binding protein [Leucobacter allii]|uniref:sugar ABC transporter substrate-binding protein n=1 Tax=Leucobacter allii TaxID=2932247 RepID=UPI001FD312AF|nr:sugar ABC transporter substrate-binding protein [Leucobacter allii]UOR01357.1 sugar ABC transporter substrate-binding protein [Leucobacter allii]
MKKKFGLGGIVASLAVAAIALSACSSGGGGGSDGGGDSGGGENVKIGISFDKMLAFREGEQKYLEEAAEDLGVELVFQNAEDDAQRQSSQIETLISQGVKGIALIPYDLEAIRADIESADAAGVTVTSFDQAPADTSWVSYHVGGDPYADGQAAAKEFIRLADGKPFTLLELQGALNNDNGIQRSKGLNDGLKGADNIEIVAQVPTDWQPEPALAGVENTLQTTPDLSGIYVPTDGELPAVFSALEAVNRKVPVGEDGHVTIISIDGDENGCQAVRDGFVDMVLATDVPTMTHNVLEQTLNGINGETVAKSEALPGIPVTPETIEENASKVWGCN